MRVPGFTLAFLLAATAPAVLTVCFLLIPVPMESEVSKRTPNYPSPTGFPSPPAPTTPDLRGLRTIPVFYKSRELMLVEDPSQLLASEPKLVMVASISGPGGKPVAYLRGIDGGEPSPVRVGDTVQGWRVAAIELRKVVLSRGPHSIEVIPPATHLNGTDGIRRVTRSEPRPEGSPSVRVLTGGNGHKSSPLATSAPISSSSASVDRTYRPPQLVSTSLNHGK